MDYKSLVRNSITAFLAQTVSIGLSVVTTIVVPKVLGVSEFGYWQLFIFYVSYAGFFHLGLSDGVYLLNGGLSRESIDRKSINSQFWFGLAYEIPISLLIVISAYASDLEQDRKFVLAAFALFIVLNNCCFYLGFIFQAINETKIYSYSVMVDRLVFLVPLLALLMVRSQDFRLYILAYCVSKICSLVYCISKGRFILTSGVKRFREILKDGFMSVRVGIKVLLANTASMLIIGIMRFVIDAQWGIEEFGKVSFSLSLVNFILFFVQQVSMVLFPALRRADRSEVISIYSRVQDVLDFVAPYVYLIYYPAQLILAWWLPDYAVSLTFFAVLLPICVFDAKMEIGCATLFKVLRMEKTWLLINVGTVCLSALFVGIGATMFGSVVYAIVGMVLALMARSVFSEYLLSKQLEVPFSHLTIINVIVSLAFSVIAFLFPVRLSFVIYIVIVVLYTITNKEQIKTLAHLMNKLIGNMRAL